MNVDFSNLCNPNIFTNFFNQNIKSLRNFLYYKYGDLEQANDIAQESFTKLWENCSKVNLEKAKSYVFTVANNASLNEIKHQKVVLHYQKTIDKSTVYIESPDFQMQESDFKQRLEFALNQLTESQRVCFLMHRMEDKKYAEIAEILGISVKAVEKRMHGALLMLKKHIKEFR